jgi:hypothetical protein
MVVVMAEKLKPDIFSLVSNYKVAKVGGFGTAAKRVEAEATCMALVWYCVPLKAAAQACGTPLLVAVCGRFE